MHHLDLKTPESHLVFAVQSTLEAAFREHALAQGFIEIHTPKISGGGSESGASVFRVPYFGSTAYLVQSPQFYMQMAMAAGFDRVFEIGPVFRSESGVTPIHATEFTIAHFEMSGIDSHDDLMSFEESLLCHGLAAVAATHGEEIEERCGVSVEIPSAGIPRYSLVEHRDIGGKTHLIGSVERALSKKAHRETGQGFVFVSDYPAEMRPFYTMRSEPDRTEESTLARSFDLLWHGIEITSGGQREHRFDRLEAQIACSDLAEETLDAYIRPHFLEMFRQGCPPHGGFGIGLNRLMMALLGRASVKETSFVYRGPKQYMP